MELLLLMVVMMPLLFQIDDLINELKVKAETDRNPLFNYLFNMNNLEREEFGILGISVKHYTRIDDNFSKFDLQLVASRIGETITLNLRNHTKLFKKSTVENYIVLYTDIINQVLSNINIKDLSMTNRLTKITSTIETESEFNFELD
ncbi:MAG: hypothetical protein GQ564_17875 [Bacteroidales bacterium]|nr:hypothetical protein [Bacteroidales bacterium]